ncbi:hypothetical protein BGZ80_004864, partial [Entomortierella chlamydospora]
MVGLYYLFHPAGGQGGRNAVSDAVVLVNSIYVMKDPSIESIKAAFEEYYRQRYPYAEGGFNENVAISKTLNGQ